MKLQFFDGKHQEIIRNLMIFYSNAPAAFSFVALLRPLGKSSFSGPVCMNSTCSFVATYDDKYIHVICTYTYYILWFKTFDIFDFSIVLI